MFLFDSRQVERKYQQTAKCRNTAETVCVCVVGGVNGDCFLVAAAQYELDSVSRDFRARNCQPRWKQWWHVFVFVVTCIQLIFLFVCFFLFLHYFVETVWCAPHRSVQLAQWDKQRKRFKSNWNVWTPCLCPIKIWPISSICSDSTWINCVDYNESTTKMETKTNQWKTKADIFHL